jgi:hypothetical protein
MVYCITVSFVKSLNCNITDISAISTDVSLHGSMTIVRKVVYIIV